MATKMWLWDYQHSFGASVFTPDINWADGDAHVNAAGDQQDYWFHADEGSQDPSTGFFRTFSNNTVAGPTSGKSLLCGWFSRPLAADVTISGTVTFNLWMYESGMNANVSAACAIYRISPDATWTLISYSIKGTEVGTSTAVQNWTATPTSTAMKKGDRIVIVPHADDAGTMGTGFTFSLDYGFGTGVAGDSWVQFNENLTFQSTAPTGTTLYLTDIASDITPGSATSLKAWSTAGSAATSDTDSPAGPWAGTQITATSGGTALEWHTPQLNAFTLGDAALCSLNVKLQNDAGAGVHGEQFRVQIAVCNADGSSPVLWGQCMFCTPDDVSSSNANKRPPTSTAATYQFWVNGYDTAVAAGQRLRIRLFLDDQRGNGPRIGAVGDTLRLAYGNTASSIRMTQSLTELAGNPPYRSPYRQLLAR